MPRRIGLFAALALLAAAMPLAAQPDSAADLAARGIAAGREGRHWEAVEHFRRALQTASPEEEAEIYFYLGVAESRLPGRELRAIAWFDAYLSARPDADNVVAIAARMESLHSAHRQTVRELLRELIRAGERSSVGRSRSDRLGSALLLAAEANMDREVVTDSLMLAILESKSLDGRCTFITDITRRYVAQRRHSEALAMLAVAEKFIDPLYYPYVFDRFHLRLEIARLQHQASGEQPALKSLALAQAEIHRWPQDGDAAVAYAEAAACLLQWRRIGEARRALAKASHVIRMPVSVLERGMEIASRLFMAAGHFRGARIKPARDEFNQARQIAELRGQNIDPGQARQIARLLIEAGDQAGAAEVLAAIPAYLAEAGREPADAAADGFTADGEAPGQRAPPIDWLQRLDDDGSHPASSCPLGAAEFVDLAGSLKSVPTEDDAKAFARLEAITRRLIRVCRVVDQSMWWTDQPARP